MRRAVPALGVAVVGAIVGLLDQAPLLAAVCLVALGAAALWRLRILTRSSVREELWAGRVLGNVHDAGEQAPVRFARPSARRVAAALARVEGRELTASPWFATGIGFCTFMVLGFGLAEGTNQWRDVVEKLPFLAHPLVGVMVVASHRAATRARRDGLADLFEACPTAPATRAVGLLGSAWVPAVALTAFFAAYLAAVVVDTGSRGPLGSALVADVLAGLVLGVGGVALGIALARWVRFAVAAVVAVALIGFISIKLAAGASGRFGWPVVFSTMPPLGDEPVDLTAGQAWWHLGWLITLVTVTALAAVARTRPSRPEATEAGRC